MRRLPLSTVLLLLLGAGCGSVLLEPETLDPLRSHAPREKAYDVEHYALELELLPETRSIRGRCTVRLRPREDEFETLELDLEGLTVSAVHDGFGMPLEFEHERGELWMRLARSCERGELVELAIDYGGAPQKGLWFAGGEDVPTHVFTQGECEDSRWWFPCFDEPSDRATHELVVTMPAHWRAVAAGAKIDERSDGDRRTEHWRIATPHAPYLTTLVAGDFVQEDGVWQGIPLAWLAEHPYAAWMAESLAETDEALDFFTKLTGVRYPYEKYSQACVENFPFGGMENISATTLTAHCLSDERGLRDDPATGLVVHEAAHQWFGDLLTCNDWSHIWLNEGFATYFTFVYFEKTRGRDEFLAMLRDAQDRYANGDRGSGRRPIVHDVYRDPIDLFFGGHTYEGGATRLHLLRHVLGDAAFERGIRLYTAENTNRGVVTDDLRAAMQEASGVDLEEFFEQWLDSPGYPEFEVFWRYDDAKQQVLLTVDQVQRVGDGTRSCYRVPVDVEVREASGRRTVRLELTRRRELFRIPSETEPEWVRFDKFGAIPKKLVTRKSLDEWLLLAAEDDDVNGRRDALLALAELAVDAKTEERQRISEVLQDRAANDPNRFVRVRAVEGLQELRDTRAKELLMQIGETDEAAACRVAAVRVLCWWGENTELALYAREVFAQGYSWKTMGAAAQLLRFSAPGEAHDQIVEWMEVESPHGTLQAELATQLGYLGDPGVLVELAQVVADPHAPVLARRASVEMLGKLGKGSSAVRDILLKLLQDRSTLLRRSALEALLELEDPSANPILREYYARCVFPRERRIIEKILLKTRS